MKKGLIIATTLAMMLGVGVAVGAHQSKAVEVKAASYSGSIIIQKNDNDAKWDGCNIVGYLFNSTSNTWGAVASNTSNKYQEYSWSISFEPTTIIMLRVPTNWSSSWDNPWWDGEGGIYARTGNVTLSSTDVIWMDGNAKEGSNWGTYQVDAVVKGGASQSWSTPTVDTKLASIKINSDNKLEAYGSVSLPADTYFKVVKGGDTWCGNYSAHSSIASNLNGGGSDNIHNIAAATYEFYFDYDAETVYITDPAMAAADEWAQYFLSNVGCDATGKDEPTGWNACATEYGKLSGDAKNIVYGATADPSGNYVEHAVARYEQALRSHPSLSHFIVNSGNTPRALAYINPSMNDFQDSNTMIIVIAIAAVSALAFTTLLVFKKKKQK